MSSIDLQNADELIDGYEKRMLTAAHRGLYSAALLGVQRILTRIIPSRTPQPTDRGIYKAGWRANPEMDGATIENLEPTAILIEDGVRAGNVKIGRLMLSALEAWVVRKGIVGADEAKGVTWAIALSMKRRGVFGSAFGGAGLGILRELVEKDLPGLMAAEVAREIKREFE